MPESSMHGLPGSVRLLLARIMRRSFSRIDLGTRRLPFEYAMHVLDGSREPELKHLPRICARQGVAVDAGANLGYYAYRMAKFFEHVYAFEPNTEISFPIRTSRLGNVSLMNLGLSNATRDSVLHIPVVGGIALGGWASLKPGNLKDAEYEIQRQVSCATLDSFELGNVALLKIDVEGHELEVLQGARGTIGESRPVLIIEIKKDRFTEVSSLLKQHGYRRVPLERIAGEVGNEENFIFMP